MCLFHAEKPNDTGASGPRRRLHSNGLFDLYTKEMSVPLDVPVWLRLMYHQHPYRKGVPPCT